MYHRLIIPPIIKSSLFLCIACKFLINYTIFIFHYLFEVLCVPLYFGNYYYWHLTYYLIFHIIFIITTKWLEDPRSILRESTLLGHGCSPKWEVSIQLGQAKDLTNLETVSHSLFLSGSIYFIQKKIKSCIDRT